MNKYFRAIWLLISIIGVFCISSCKNNSQQVPDSVPSIESSDISDSFELKSEVREKINKLEKDFTQEQVHEILGEPDEVPPTGIYWEYYFIDENIKMVIGYFSDGISVELIDSREHKSEKIL